MVRNSPRILHHEVAIQYQRRSLLQRIKPMPAHVTTLRKILPGTKCSLYTWFHWSDFFGPKRHLLFGTYVGHYVYRYCHVHEKKEAPAAAAAIHSSNNTKQFVSLRSVFLVFFCPSVDR